MLELLVRSWAMSSSPATVETSFRILAAVFGFRSQGSTHPPQPVRWFPVAEAVLTRSPLADQHRDRAGAPRGDAVAPPGVRDRRCWHRDAARRSSSASRSTAWTSSARRSESTDNSPPVGGLVAWAETKTAASVRVIPVDDVVIEAVAAHLAAYPSDGSGLVLRSAIGTPLRPSTLWMAWNKAAKAVGTDATPHDLRHYFASVLIRAGLRSRPSSACSGTSPRSRHWTPTAT